MREQKTQDYISQTACAFLYVLNNQTVSIIYVRYINMSHKLRDIEQMSNCRGRLHHLETDWYNLGNFSELNSLENENYH